MFLRRRFSCFHCRGCGNSLRPERRAGSEPVHKSGSAVDNSVQLISQGRLFYHVIGSFAEFEREMIAERVRAGIFKSPNVCSGRSYYTAFLAPAAIPAGTAPPASSPQSLTAQTAFGTEFRPRRPQHRRRI